MAYAIVHHFPAGTKDKYEISIAAVHPTRSSLPVGQIFHAAGPSAGGWTIMAVHDSNVWTGGVLQEKSVKLEYLGLAPMYPAFGWSSWAPGHHGYKRAFDLISG